MTRKHRWWCHCGMHPQHPTYIFFKKCLYYKTDKYQIIDLWNISVFCNVIIVFCKSITILEFQQMMGILENTWRGAEDFTLTSHGKFPVEDGDGDAEEAGSDMEEICWFPKFSRTCLTPTASCPALDSLSIISSVRLLPALQKSKSFTPFLLKTFTKSFK